MKKLLLCLPAALSLAACAAAVPLVASAAGLPTSPAAAANKTVLDEQAVNDVELAYKGFRLAVETGVDAGLIKGANATRAADLDNKAYAALKVARAAYRAGNAPDYFAALAQARAAIADGIKLIPSH